MSDSSDVLVAARSDPRGAVHASPLIRPVMRPDLGLTPWNPLCSTGWTTTRTDEPVTCRTCLAVMRRRALTLGDRL
ncbi:hypothetical protein [Streptomyces sp. SPB074]|uniref:hypothetical protein n=1 Tax=Streptomyces sp. (strain SPB074) TaxID=465543 RepID=UPI00017FE9B2|nr:hypothetical protein [Streptomyces sp. SPB074]EDY43942.1 hypothetical protein SSBG_02132 [Streptomyces sp. SPB074]